MKYKMHDLGKRLLMAVVVITAAALAVSFSNTPVGAFFAYALIASLGGVGMWEFARFLKAKGLKPQLPIMVILSTLLLFLFSGTVLYSWSIAWISLTLFLGAIYFFVSRFNKISNAMLNIAGEILGVLYVSFPLATVLGIMLNPLWAGRLWIAYLLIVAKGCDVAAYFCGRLWGKKKLASKLSPKKTVVGAIAGIIFSLVISIALSLIAKYIPSTLWSLSLSEAIFLGALIGGASLIGDLAESLIKRDVDIKDSNALPGFGGILDMLDSLLFTAPFIYFYLELR